MTESLASKRIERALADLGAEHEPPAGWEARVFAAIARERIEGELAHLGEEHEPPTGWEERVLAATAAVAPIAAGAPTEEGASTTATMVTSPITATARSRRRWGLATGGVTALVGFAAAVAVIVRSSSSVDRGGEVAEMVLEVNTTPGTVTMRGDTVGRLTASVSGGVQRALWIYRRDLALMAACPGDPRCRTSGDKLAIEIDLDLVGMYRVVALTATTAIPVPRGNYDEDTVAAARAGAKFRSEQHEVR